MKVFRSFRECGVCFVITAAVCSITLTLPEEYGEFQNEVALAILQSEKEDKKRLIAKAFNMCIFVPTNNDPVFFLHLNK